MNATAQEFHTLVIAAAFLALTSCRSAERAQAKATTDPAPAIADVDASAPWDASAGARPVEAVDKTNWARHPAITEIRALCQSVETAISDKTLRPQRRTYDCLPGESERTAFVDGAGRVRKLVRKGGSEDSAVTVEQCFDESGQLRFAFFVAGAVNGSKLEQRRYFDASGRSLWKHDDLVGPGYTWVLDIWLRPRAPKDVADGKPPCN